MDEITNSQDIIDSRSVIERIAELAPFHVEDTRIPDSAAFNDLGSFKTEQEAADWIAEQDEQDRPHFEVVEYSDESEELRTLQEFAEQGEEFPDWPYGEAFIRDSYFEDYARELADDIGAINSEIGWPMSYIDWEAAADALKMDYSSVEFAGVTYWARS